MAIVTGKRKNILDINEDVTIGVGFPLNEINLFKGTKTTHEQTKANLLNLIMTNQGERVNLPNYGIGLKNLLFENNINERLLTDTIREQVSRYIPAVAINDVRVNRSEDLSTLYVQVSYTYLLDSSTNNIQINFN